MEEQDFELDRLAVTNREDTDMVTVLMNNLRSPFYRVGPASIWEGRAAHVMRMVRTDVATPLASDEFTAPLPEAERIDGSGAATRQDRERGRGPSGP